MDLLDDISAFALFVTCFFVNFFFDFSMNPYVGPPSPTVNFQYSRVKEPTTNTATLPSVLDQGSGIQCLFDPGIRDG